MSRIRIASFGTISFVRQIAQLQRAPCLLVTTAAVVSALALFTAGATAGCNSGDVAKTDLLSSHNCQANATASYGTAVGAHASAGTSATAFGFGAWASGENSTAVGYATASSRGATVVGAVAGTWSGSNGVFSTTLGGASYSAAAPSALGDYSIAIGGGDGSTPFGKALVGALSRNLLAVAVGTTSYAASDFAIAIGFNANAAGTNAINPIAIGADATATGDSSTALGRFSSATGAGSVAVGASAGTSGSGDYDIAVGYGAGRAVSGNNNIGIGRNAGNTINASNTIAIARTRAPRVAKPLRLGPLPLRTSRIPFPSAPVASSGAS